MAKDRLSEKQKEVLDLIKRNELDRYTLWREFHVGNRTIDALMRMGLVAEWTSGRLTA
jgi:hypothetical protein